MKNKPNILVCPLDWGIGHATRMVPVIRELIRQQTIPIIAASGRSLAFLKLEFPELKFVNFPGYDFSYPANGSMVLKMTFQAPGILKGIRKEKKVLDQLVKDFEIDGVISDNRYGLSSYQVPSVFITHQLRIQVPRYLSFIQPLIFRMNMHFISKFTECWVPDFVDVPNLSGALSHENKIRGKTFFVGPLSRFAGIPLAATDIKKEDSPTYDFLVLLSGPEPQRSILEEKILDQLRSNSFSAIVVQGKPDFDDNVRIEGTVKIFPHLDTEKLRTAFRESGLVLSRPGYSTLMDLCFIGKKAVFIPTPGQTEQEFLAKYCLENKWFYSMDQKSIDLTLARENAKQYPGFTRTFDQSILNERISAFLSSL